jgi:hypothetical protein
VGVIKLILSNGKSAFVSNISLIVYFSNYKLANGLYAGKGTYGSLTYGQNTTKKILK